jgi:hypothetical protein
MNERKKIIVKRCKEDENENDVGRMRQIGKLFVIMLMHHQNKKKEY